MNLQNIVNHIVTNVKQIIPLQTSISQDSLVITFTITCSRGNRGHCTSSVFLLRICARLSGQHGKNQLHGQLCMNILRGQHCIGHPSGQVCTSYPSG